MSAINKGTLIYFSFAFMLGLTQDAAAQIGGSNSGVPTRGSNSGVPTRGSNSGVPTQGSQIGVPPQGSQIGVPPQDSNSGVNARVDTSFNSSISKMRPFWNVIARGSDFLTLETTVLAFEHASQVLKGLNGKEEAPWHYWIRTPLVRNCRVMYRFTMIGYACHEAKPIDAIWVGYLHGASASWWQTFSEVKYIDGAQATIDLDEDDHLVLKLGPISSYGNAFELRYQGYFQNATLGLKVNEYSVTATFD